MAHARRFTLCAAALVGWTSAALHTRVPTAALRRTVSSGARTHALASATAPAANPLLDQAALPRFGTIDASHVQPAMSELLGEFTRGLRALEADLSVALRSDQPGTLTWASVVERLERLRAPLEYSYGVVSHLTGVKSSDALRDAHQQVQPLVVEAMSSFQQSRPLCDAYRRLIADSDAAVVAGDAPTLDDAQRRIVQSALAEMELAGVALEGEAQARFNAIKLELAELATTFSNHVLDATKAYGLELTSREQVAGFPPSLLAMTAAAAAAAGNAHATAEAGPWRVTLDGPCYVSLMQSASDRSLRERVYRAYATRAGAGSAFDNSATVRRVLELRASMAALLGRESYAHVSLARKMAGEPAAVNALIERVRDAARPAAEAELGELRAFAAERGQAEPLALWDVPYWAERRREALFAFSDEELRAYFPLERVLDGLFALVDKLFSVAVVRADGEAEAWHADVGYYKLIDRATGEERAAFFLDPYARPAEKRPGAWMDVCTGRSEALGRKPVAYLTCNSAPPVGEMPALLAFRDVQTLFHETGHGARSPAPSGTPLTRAVGHPAHPRRRAPRSPAPSGTPLTRTWGTPLTRAVGHPAHPRRRAPRSPAPSGTPLTRTVGHPAHTRRRAPRSPAPRARAYAARSHAARRPTTHAHARAVRRRGRH